MHCLQIVFLIASTLKTKNESYESLPTFWIISGSNVAARGISVFYDDDNASEYVAITFDDIFDNCKKPQNTTLESDVKLCYII